MAEEKVGFPKSPPPPPPTTSIILWPVPYSLEKDYERRGLSKLTALNLGSRNLPPPRPKTEKYPGNPWWSVCFSFWNRVMHMRSNDRYSAYISAVVCVWSASSLLRKATFRKGIIEYKKRNEYIPTGISIGVMHLTLRAGLFKSRLTLTWG